MRPQQPLLLLLLPLLLWIRSLGMTGHSSPPVIYPHGHLPPPLDIVHLLFAKIGSTVLLYENEVKKENK